MKDKETGAELVGSFTVEIGDQDEAGDFAWIFIIHYTLYLY